MDSICPTFFLFLGTVLLFVIRFLLPKNLAIFSHIEINLYYFQTQKGKDNCV